MPPPPPNASTSARPDVFFALTEFEMQNFFPSGRPVGSSWTDPNRCIHRSQYWSDVVSTHRPRVVVCGWVTPPLPLDLIDGRGGPVEYVCQVTGSVRHVVSREMLTEGLLVSNWGPLVAPLVAEHALLLLLAALRNLGRWSDFIRPSAPSLEPTTLQTRTLRGKRVALYGFGAIARQLVALLQPFGVQLVGYSAGVPIDHFTALGVTPASSLVEACQGANALVCCESLTYATRGSINAGTLAALDPDSVFVNVGRGAIVDEAALFAAARQQGLRIASDVFTTEPLSPDSPLFTVPGAILSPHIAGPTHDSFIECGRHALANIDRFLKGEQPTSLIDPDTYNRST